jgi:hypothetical protein
MILYAVAHPIDTEQHPTIPAGFRWAVYRSEMFADATECLGAGWAPDDGAAVFISDQAAFIAVKALRDCGVPASMENVKLDHDPILSGQDFLRVG